MFLCEKLIKTTEILQYWHPSVVTFISRNIARLTVSTHFVFSSDIELYPR